MTLMDPRDYPSIEIVLKKKPVLVGTLKGLGITSTANLMCLPRLVVRDLFGISRRGERFIASALIDHKLRQRQMGDRLADFVEDEFGCVEDASVTTLNVTTIMREGFHIPAHRPLNIVQRLHELSPNFTVRDILELEGDDLLDMLCRPVLHDARRHIMELELNIIDDRLRSWDPTFRVGGLAGATPLRQRPKLLVM